MEDDANADERSGALFATALRDLQRKAYGRVHSDKEAREALQAQLDLRGLEPRITPSTRIGPQGAGQTDAPGTEGGPPDGEDETDEQPPREAREPLSLRSIIPLPVTAFVCLIVGILVGRFGLDPTTPTRPPAKAATSSVTIDMPTGDRYPTTIGKEWFARPQEAADKFLFYNAPGALYDPSTVRMIDASATLGSVFIAKRAPTRPGVCVVFLSPPAKYGGQYVVDKCVTPASFLKSGISFTSDGVRVQWTSKELSLTSAG